MRCRLRRHGLRHASAASPPARLATSPKPASRRITVACGATAGAVHRDDRAVARQFAGALGKLDPAKATKTRSGKGHATRDARSGDLLRQGGNARLAISRLTTLTI